MNEEKVISDEPLLVAFSQEKPARLLSNYLQLQGISVAYVRVNQANEHGIKLLDLNKQLEASNIIQEFIHHPNQQKYQEAAWQSGQTVNMTSPSWFSLQAIVNNLKTSPFAACILMLCILTFSLALMGVSQPYEWLRILPFKELIENHQWWRLIGPAFIHFSFLHIAFNLLWWWMLGKQIEQTFGLSGLVMLFLFTAITSNVAQLLVSGPIFGGLSGVVYGLVGCTWWLGWLRPNWGISLPKPIIGFLLVWLLVGYTDILWIKMANTSHTVGLISGCLFAVFLSLTQKKINSDKYTL